LVAGLDRFYDDHQANKLRNKRATAYLTTCDNFMTLLVAAVHLASGQPARATELETMTISNGIRARSLFFSQGSVFVLFCFLFFSFLFLSFFLSISRFLL
jgi:hypothetical protein